MLMEAKSGRAEFSRGYVIWAIFNLFQYAKAVANYEMNPIAMSMNSA